MMNIRIVLALSAMALAYTALAAMGQSAPPTYKADPDVYKVIFEDENFRVIAATHNKGVPDKMHVHGVPSIAYNLTDCHAKHYSPDGTVRDDIRKAGTVFAMSSATPHSTESDCRQIFVERK